MTYKKSLNHLDELILRINSDFKKLIRPLDTYGLKLEDVILLEQKLNKTMGDIELQITMNSIMQQRMNTEFEALKTRQVEEPEENIATNEARIKKLAKVGRIKATEQAKQLQSINEHLNVCIKDSSRVIDQLNEIILRPPLRLEELESNIDFELMRGTAKKLTGEASRLTVDLNGRHDEIKILTKKLKNYQPKEDQYTTHVDSTSDYHKDVSNKVKKKKTLMQFFH